MLPTGLKEGCYMMLMDEIPRFTGENSPGADSHWFVCGPFLSPGPRDLRSAGRLGAKRPRPAASGGVKWSKK